ncbi:MAG: DUF805 domain-containing protein [Salegentibacter sp.]
MKWFFLAFKHYSDFTGRSRRKEYWMFILFNMFLSILVMLLDLLFSQLTGVIGMLFLPYVIVIIIPALAVSVRRLHDTGNSGLMYFVNFIPFIGGIWFLILCLTDSEPAKNKWGHNPKDPEHL